ncbi:chorismate-binding protein [Arthrobacter sp. Br18]|uniref:chorismate-binding protein n=1 Tax=Arthrobacter sp. Br18 TaxID=1312954 RepID=UPI0004B652EA|nr:chorismate-binding protein [Arthrobacter sp. Br18]
MTPPRPVPLIIAIDGRSGAGKTTLAAELAALLREHHTVSMFHLEDIYPGWDGLRGGIDRYVHQVLTPLAEGMQASWREWDWIADCDGGMRHTPPADIVLVEGVGAAAREARGLLDAVLWVEAPGELRRSSALARDGGTYAPFWDRWADQESRWLDADSPAASADVVVQGHSGPATPHRVRLALTGLPQCERLMSVERAARRGLSVRTERIDAEPDTAALFAALYPESQAAVWLDSSDAGATPGSDRSRFTILADDAGQFGQRVRHTDGVTEVSAGAVTSRIREPFFRWLDNAWGRRVVRRPDGYECGFALGWLGYLGYELKRESGGASLTSSALPDAALIFAGRAVVIDHREGSVFLLVLTDGPPDAECVDWQTQARAAVLNTGQAAPRPGAPEPAASASLPGPAFAEVPVFEAKDSRAGYLAKIRRAQEEITEGNTYEVCLTTSLGSTVDRPVDPLAVYLQLRRASPAPFGHLIRWPGFAVASTSPERFLRIDSDGGIRAEPIKGTRGRSLDPVADAGLRRDLAASLKDRAENIMIVDLLRNDLSHHAVPGSVTVTRLCDIETYATVHQLVSTIEATLKPGASRAEVIASAFPAGSMTGAPKISTMAILDALEGRPRGVYSGAAGYLSLTGAADLAVVIRTLVIEHTNDGARLSLGVGGAITADSVPSDEWEEVRIKARGVLTGLGAEFPESPVLPPGASRAPLDKLAP